MAQFRGVRWRGAESPVACRACGGRVGRLQCGGGAVGGRDRICTGVWFWCDDCGKASWLPCRRRVSVEDVDRRWCGVYGERPLVKRGASIVDLSTGEILFKANTKLRERIILPLLGPPSPFSTRGTLFGGKRQATLKERSQLGFVVFISSLIILFIITFDLLLKEVLP